MDGVGMSFNFMKMILRSEYRVLARRLVWKRGRDRAYFSIAS